ncbi:hypothetical protein V3N99_06480 [Dermatophilaceae bacterium Soc4.6]
MTCGRARHLGEGDRCAGCLRAARPPRPPKTSVCRRCGQQRRNVGHGLCNRCAQADPDRPFRYAASMATRLETRLAAVPPWWPSLAVFAAARFHPGGAVTVLRETGRLLLADPALGPHQLMNLAPPQLSSTTVRVLTAYFTDRGLALPPDAPQQRAAARRAQHLADIDVPLREAVAAFNDTQMNEQDRRRRTGRHTLSDVTLETRLRIVKALARHLLRTRTVTGWAEVTTQDLESFLARTPAARHQQTYVLRRFFTWAKAHKIVLTDATRPLALGAQPAFTGTVLEVGTQRALFARWTLETTPPSERLVGLLALLHAASNAEIRLLTLTDIDHTQRTVTLLRRPFPTPLDPPTWAALQACLTEREATATLNPHVIVTRITASRDTPAASSYLTRLLSQAGTTPAACRQTRLTELVNDLDPKLTAAALGMNGTGIARYAADNVARDRLHRHTTNPA